MMRLIVFILATALGAQTLVQLYQTPKVIGDAGMSSIINCTDTPGQCDFVLAALEQYAITWQGLHQFEMPLELKAQAPPAWTPKLGYARPTP